MLERLVAGVLLIGALLWAASTLATPDSPPLVDGDGAIVPADAGPDPLVDTPAPDPAPAPVPDEDRTEDQAEPDGSTRDGKGRGKRGDGG